MIRDIGVYVGRFSPFHNGHYAVAQEMIRRYGYENCIIVIGSLQQTKQTPFTYQQRRYLIKTLFPEIMVMPYNDLNDDVLWFDCLNHNLEIVFGNDRQLLTHFYSGSDHDIMWVPKDNPHFKTRIVNDRTSNGISGTSIRECLKNNGIPQDIPKGILKDVLVFWKQNETSKKEEIHEYQRVAI